MNSSAWAWPWIEAILAWFYPAGCQFCGERRSSAREGYVCGVCRRQVRFIQSPYCEQCGLPYDGDISASFVCQNCRETVWWYRSARAAVIASGLVLEAIHRYKYNRALWLEPFLADLLLQSAVPSLRRDAWDWIVPVPLHPVKLRQREFNQAERLARRLSRETEIPLHGRLLRRVEFTRTQTRLSRAERKANVRAAFNYISADRLRGDRIILVDDVYTTGATTNACARVLRRAGAGEICVWALARGL